MIFLAKTFFKFTFLALALRTNGLEFLPLLEILLFLFFYFFSFVKSAREVSMTLSTRFHHFTPVVWQALWGLKLQARLKHLLWKIGWDILPSRANIGRFIILEDANAWVCPFCNGPLETLSHIFLDCALAKVLWRFAVWPLNISHFSSRPISEWILAIIYPL